MFWLIFWGAFLGFMLALGISLGLIYTLAKSYLPRAIKGFMKGGMTNLLGGLMTDD